MEKICQQCGNEKKFVPAGISKRTGRRYEAFSVCEHCKGKQQYQKTAIKEEDQAILIRQDIKDLSDRISKMGVWLQTQVDELKELLKNGR